LLELNKIYNEDYLIGIKNIKDNFIDLVITDPPYKLVAGGKTAGSTGGIFTPSEASKSGKCFKENNIKFSDWSLDTYRVLKNGGHCYVMVNDRNMQELLNAFTKVGFKVLNILFWDKGNVTPNKWYMKAGEFIVMFRKGKAININNMGDSTLLEFKNIIGHKLHPTEKPVDLITKLILNSSKENDIILDPFMGSGTTAVACINAKRQYIGFELDTTYYELANKRIQDIVSI